MKYENLTAESFLMVNGVLYSGWIPPLKNYGPIRRCSIRVCDIINLLNNDINVLLTDEQNEALYFFVKQFNTMIDFQHSSKNKATRAEAVLYERVYKKALEQEKAEDLENPFISDDEEELDIAAETIALQSKGSLNGFDDPLKNIRKNRVQITRPHAYDIFKNTNNESLNSKLADAKELVEYGDIDFNVE